MGILISLFIFFLCIGFAFKAGALLLKIIFTVIGILVGGSIIIALLPLGIGLGLVLLVPTIIIGIIVSIIKTILFIF